LGLDRWVSDQGSAQQRLSEPTVNQAVSSQMAVRELLLVSVQRLSLIAWINIDELRRAYPVLASIFCTNALEDRMNQQPFNDLVAKESMVRHNVVETPCFIAVELLGSFFCVGAARIDAVYGWLNLFIETPDLVLCEEAFRCNCPILAGRFEHGVAVGRNIELLKLRLRDHGALCVDLCGRWCHCAGDPQCGRCGRLLRAPSSTRRWAPTRAASRQPSTG
jgi:hypothetical protein